MAVPKVFISSTFYDLRQVRNNIETFIKSLGYEATMHERAMIGYSQNNSLEYDCYKAIASCEIVVCIIGNHFGSKSEQNELSITMNELDEAIKANKKVYIFIAKDVFTENRTYEKNRGNENFNSAYADDLRIHEFILHLKNNIRNNVIEAFENTEEIITTLKLQFAGLFQGLLARESALTEEKTAYDLQETIEKMKKILTTHESEHRDFLSKIDSTYFRYSSLLNEISKHLGLKTTCFFARELEQLDDFLKVIGYDRNDEEDGECRRYVLERGNTRYTLVLNEKILNEDGKLNKFLSEENAQKYVSFTYEDIFTPLFSSDTLDEMPF